MGAGQAIMDPPSKASPTATNLTGAQARQGGTALKGRDEGLARQKPQPGSLPSKHPLQERTQP